MFNKKQREFIVEEQDVTTILKVMNSQLGYIDNLHVGNCGWEDSPSKWYILFYSNDKKYANTMRELSNIGKFEASAAPKGNKICLYFTRSRRRAYES